MKTRSARASTSSTTFTSKRCAKNNSNNTKKCSTAKNSTTSNITKSNKIQFSPPINESSCDTDDLDDTVLDLLNTPTKIDICPPLTGLNNTPSAIDKTYDFMEISSDKQTQNDLSTNSTTCDKGVRLFDNDDSSSPLSIEKSIEQGIEKNTEKPRAKRPPRNAHLNADINTDLTLPKPRGTPRIMPPTTSNIKKRQSSKAVDNESIQNNSILSMTSITAATTSSKNDNDGAELRLIADEVRSLSSELQYYEQLTGRVSALGFDLNALENAVVPLDEKNTRQSLLEVMKSLNHLVCQTMSYLLKSEVDAQSARSREEDLQSQVDSLKALMMHSSLETLRPVNDVTCNKNNSVSEDVLLAATQVPETANTKSTTTNRVPKTILNEHIASLRNVELNDYHTAHSDYNSQKYSPDAVIFDSEEASQAALNISLSEGSVKITTAPFSANISPVRHGFHAPISNDQTVEADVSSLKAQLPGNSTTDLLFPSSMNSYVESSLSETIGPALHYAVNNAEQISSTLKTKSYSCIETESENVETETSLSSANRAYQEYLATQNRIELFDTSTEESDSYIDYASENEDGAVKINTFEDDEQDDIWNSRLQALGALNDGVSQLAYAVTTVKTKSSNDQHGPFSTIKRDAKVKCDSNKENIKPEARTPTSAADSDETPSIVIPHIVVPKPVATPMHPFAENNSTMRQVSYTSQENQTKEKALARGRLRERTFNF